MGIAIRAWRRSSPPYDTGPGTYLLRHDDRSGHRHGRSIPVFGRGVTTPASRGALDAARDGYTLIGCTCAALSAFFGVWAVSELAVLLGFDVYLGGHNAGGLVFLSFFAFVTLGALSAVFGRAALESRSQADR